MDSPETVAKSYQGLDCTEHKTQLSTASEQSSTTRPCCECHRVQTSCWSTFVGPLTVVKLGLQSLKTHLDALDVEVNLDTDLGYCLHALSDLEDAHLKMTERMRMFQRYGPQCVDLASFVRQVNNGWKIQARRSACKVLLQGFRSLPKIKVDRKCFWCLLDSFLSHCLAVGSMDTPWKLVFSGSAAKHLVTIQVRADHPGNDRVLRETLDRVEENRPPACQNQLQAEYRRDADQELVAFTFRPLMPEELLTRDGK